MAGDTLQFVDSVSASATLRLDLNDQTLWALTRFNAPPPRLRRTIASNAMRPGGLVGASVHDLRQLDLTLEIITSSQDNGATELQKLVRELDRPDNYLKYQPVGATKPVFFHTLRSQITSIEDIVGARTYRRITVEVIADPYALGLQEAITANTFKSDPAAGTNLPTFKALPTILGDVPAPLDFSCSTVNASLLLAATALQPGLSMSAPVYQQPESYTMGTDASVTADAAFSGGNYVHVTFSTDATLVGRFSGNSGNFPLTAEYRAYGRITKGSTATAVTFRFDQKTTDGAVIPGPYASYGPANVDLVWADLGVIPVPFAAMNAPTNLSPNTGINFDVKIQRTAGASYVDVDVLLFIPVGGPAVLASSVLVWKVPDTTNGTPSGANWASSEAEAFYFKASGSNTTQPRSPMPCTGAFPWVYPGVNNYVHSLGNLDAAPAITATHVIDFYYNPRYLYVRPVST